MTGEEMLFEMIIKTNQSVLDELNVQILFTDLEFTLPSIRDGGEEYNTVVMAEAVRGMTIGFQTYQYFRPDIQQLFTDLGYDEVTVAIDRDKVNEVTVLQALKKKHNLQLRPIDIRAFTYVDDVVTFEVHPDNYMATGMLTVKISEVALMLAEHFPNNVLDGLYSFSSLDVLAPETQLAGFQAEG